MYTETTIVENSIDIQQTILQSICLHLLPGLLFIPVFLVVSRFTDGMGLPKHLAPFLITFSLVIMPFELGYLLFQGKKTNGWFSLKSVILYREPLPLRQYFLLGIPILLWAVFLFKVAASPTDAFLIKHFFSWMPDSFMQGALLDNLGEYNRTTLVITGMFTILLIGIVGPWIEELYFRGYLLPRIPAKGIWAPVINTVLFSLYHFWSPWQFFVRIFSTFPMYYAVWRTKNVYLAITWHVLANILSASLLFAGILSAAR